MKPPLLQFDSVKTFSVAHKSATEAERAIEIRRIEDFNKKELKYTGYFVGSEVSLGTEGSKCEHVFRVRIDRYFHLFPTAGQNFGVRLVKDEHCKIVKRARHFENAKPTGLMPAVEVIEVTSPEADWKGYTEIRVTAGCWTAGKEGGSRLGPGRASDAEIVKGFQDVSKPQPEHSIAVEFTLRLSTHTYDVELRALDRLMLPGHPGRPQLEYHVMLSSTQMFSHKGLPFFDFAQIADARRAVAERIFEQLNVHQQKAYKALETIAKGNFFLPGCPGSGKTYWATRVALLYQTGVESTHVLYLLDINKPLGAVADRMRRLYQDEGLNRKVVRLGLWPVRSETVRNEEDTRSVRNTWPDFTSAFLRITSRCAPPQPSHGCPDQEAHWKEGIRKSWGKMSRCSTEDRVTTLDEEACHFLSQNQKQHATLARRVESAWREGRGPGTIYEPLAELYAQTLKGCSFVAATPVAAATDWFARVFSPQVIIFDEAAHARELATLVPAAFFVNSQVRIFIGDPKQSVPWVSGSEKSEYRDQLKVSLLQRAVHKGVPTAQLMINRRAYAGLEKLPSKLFYGGKIISAHSSKSDELPPPVQAVRQWMNQLRKRSSDEPRALVDLSYSQWTTEEGSTSPDNEDHRHWALAHAKQLLQEDWFTSVGDPKVPGRILLLTTASASLKKYQQAVSKWDSKSRGRVDLRTIDTAQGMEDDVVFLDIVKGSEFIDDEHRLCVALTRAIQGEIILMDSSASVSINTREGRRAPRYLSKVWTHCEMHGQLLTEYTDKWSLDAQPSASDTSMCQSNEDMVTDLRKLSIQASSG